MNTAALISICIPAYKRIKDLKQLLDSINVQTFKDFEVIVTDDSPDDTVRKFLVEYNPDFKLVYFKNDPVLGTPENWNEGIRKATGDWIKIMHDDDYFTSIYSLQFFADAIIKNPVAEVFFW
ncbi:MAG: glycosyltransferase family 2 protein [Ferruginibacter sp.]|nr:glycosyltransferase family 2 protein [Ferruginibacter sp.]